MGGAVATPVARRSEGAGPATRTGAARGGASTVAGLPQFMTVTSGGAAQAQIAALQQQEQTEDRSVAESLADRIGQGDAREAMQAEDARQAARTDAAQTGQDATQDLQREASAGMSVMPQGPDAVSRADDAGLSAGEAGADARTSSRADDEDGGAPGGAGARDGQGAAGAAGATRGAGAAAGGAGGAGGAAGAGGAPAGGGAATAEGGAATATGPGATAGAAGAAGGGGPAGGAAGAHAGAAADGGSLADDLPRTQDAGPQPDTGAGSLDTGDLVLIDVELAEHQRWASAEQVVGEAGSMQRAEFIAETAGGGFIGGVASGAAMGLGIGLVTRAVPVLGPIIGGGMALHGLITRDWAATGATIGRFGEGNDTYDTLANTLASVSAIIDVVSGVLDTIGGIVGIVEAVAIGVAAGAGVLAFFTFGATAGIAIAAGELAADCEEIREGISAVTTVLNDINMQLLNPCILLFRALHEFTADADPREIQANGHDLSGAAGAVGGALGGWLGGHAASLGGRAHPPAEEGAGTSQRPPHESPPAAPGEGPEVHFQEPPVAPTSEAVAAGGPARPTTADIEATPGARRIADDQATPPPASEAVATPAPGAAAGESPTPAQSPIETAPSPAAPTGAAEAPARPQDRRSRRVAASEESFGDAEFDAVVRDARNSPLGYELEASTRRAPEAIPTDTTHSRARVDAIAHSDARANPPPGRVPGAQIQHDTKTLDVTRNLPPGMAPMHPDVINENLRYLQSRSALPATELLVDPRGGGTRYYADEVPRGGLGDAGARGEQFDLFTPAGPARAPDYSTEHKFADASLIPQSSRDITAARRSAGLPELDPYMQAISAGEYARWRTSGHSGTERSGANLDLAGNASRRPGPEPPPRTASPQLELDFSSPAPARTSPETPLQVSDASTRSSEPLTRAQYEENAAMAVEMGMPADQIHQAQGDTSYHPGYDALLIGADVNPLPASQRPTDLANPANAALEPRAVIGHEVIGHREAALGGATRDEVWHEELQASARAALHTPGLSREQSWLLLQDAAARRRFQSGDGEIYIDTERYGPAAEVQRRPPSGSGEGGEPSVIIDPSLYDEPAAPVQRATPPEPEPEPPTSGPRPPTTPTPSGGSGSTGGGAGEVGAHATGEHAGPTAGSRAHQVAALFLPQVFGGGGEAPTYAQQQAAHRAEFTADNQPAAGVERVNPHYSSPPGTPDQIVALQNEILNLLAVRARAQAEAAHESDRVDACEANRAPITATIADTRGGLSAVAAHEQAVQRRDAANQAQQQRQQESEGLTSGYPNQATGLTVLSAPLAAWETFTSLASHLPGSAGDKMSEMNEQAQQMQRAFDHMGAHMAGADGAQPARAAALDGDAQRIAATGTQAQSTQQELQTAAQGAAGLQSGNEATLAAAQQRHDAASQRAADLDAAAQDRQQAADTLADQMRAWAQTHHDQRAQAIAATVDRLQSEGRMVTDRPPE